ncbi:MAG: hypothetical protein QF745_06245, partial [Planctomycetota bacterium]|nr:hypothetical protein [Planctomycetota bacterium]
HNLEALLASTAHSAGGTNLGEVGFGAAALFPPRSIETHLPAIVLAMFEHSAEGTFELSNIAEFGKRLALGRHSGELGARAQDLQRLLSVLLASERMCRNQSIGFRGAFGFQVKTYGIFADRDF